MAPQHRQLSLAPPSTEAQYFLQSLFPFLIFLSGCVSSINAVQALRSLASALPDLTAEAELEIKPVSQRTVPDMSGL